jgi:hypothetical protein
MATGAFLLRFLRKKLSSIPVLGVVTRPLLGACLPAFVAPALACARRSNLLCMHGPLQFKNP